MFSFSLVHIGIVILAVAIAYALYRWWQFKQTVTPREIAARNAATRENFDKVEPEDLANPADVQRPQDEAPETPGERRLR